jgi:hypothetical protein
MADTDDKGPWARKADEGIVPRELGGTDAPEDKLGPDPELGSGALGRTTGTDQPTTEEGIDPSAGDRADAVTDGGQNPPQEAEPDLRDAPAASVRRDDD